MKLVKIIILLILLTFLIFLIPGNYRLESIKISLKGYEEIRDYDIGKIKEEGEQLVLLTGKLGRRYGKDIVIYSLEDGEEIYRKDISYLNPWKIVVGDVDGDGLDDISIGVYKKSPLHPVMAKRPFIYSFVEGSLEAKWRGSRLSKPFNDYSIIDLDGDEIDEIVAIEILQDGKKIINTYKWKGFGFEGFVESQAFQDISDLRKTEEGIRVRVKEEGKSYKGVLTLRDNNLTIERMD